MEGLKGEEWMESAERREVDGGKGDTRRSREGIAY